jgi:uncharacterized membrane protein
MEQSPNRLLAALAYLIPLIGPLVVVVFDRRNLFAFYHACQALTLVALAIVLPVGWAVISWATAWVPMAGPTMSATTFTIVIAGLVMVLVLSVVGIVNALNGKMTPLFLIGRRGERLFVRLFPERVVKSNA